MPTILNQHLLLVKTQTCVTCSLPNPPLYCHSTLHLDPLGGGLRYKKDRVLSGNFEKNPEDVPRSCFVGVAWNVFHLLALPILNLHIVSCHIFFGSIPSIKRYRKAPAVDLLKHNIPRDTKRYIEHSCPFYMGIPHPSLLNNQQILVPYLFLFHLKCFSVLYLIQAVSCTKHISFVISTNCFKDMESNKESKLTPTTTLQEK